MNRGGISMQGISVVLGCGRENLVLAGRVWRRERIAARVSCVGIGQPASRAGQTNAAAPWSVDSLVLLVSRRHGVVEKAVARANRLTSVTGWIPRQAHARFEEPGPVESVAVGHSGIAGKKQARRSVYVLATLCAGNVRRLIKVLHPVVFFALGEVRFPSHTQLEGEPLSQANIIVYVRADGVLPPIKRLHTSLHKVTGNAQQEISQRVARGAPVKSERAIRDDVVPVIEKHMDPVHAH